MYTEKGTGEVKPTQKGIRLTEDSWQKLKDMIAEIDEQIEALRAAPESDKIRYVRGSKR